MGYFVISFTPQARFRVQHWIFNKCPFSQMQNLNIWPSSGNYPVFTFSVNV